MRMKDSDDLLRVGPGTTMGEMMRQYWIPAAMSSELEGDGAPMRLVLLGEKLIAFRDSSGRVGVMDHRCPHRCASLFLGRNEENGIRCVYHGWKYDAEGNCVDMPNAPPRQDFKTRSRPRPTRSPSATASSGSIWAPAKRRRHCRRSRPRCCPRPNCRSRSCSANATGCRRSRATSTPRISAFCMPAVCSPRTWRRTACCAGRSTNRAPEYHVTDTDYGTMYCAYRAGREGPDLLALCQFPVPVLDPDAAGPVRPRQCTPRLGPDGRHPHDVRQPELARLAGVDAPPEERADGAGIAARLRLFAEHDRLVRPLAAHPETRPTTG